MLGAQTACGGEKVERRDRAAANSTSVVTLHLMTVDQPRLVRLVEMQYVRRRPQSERKALYVITDRGRQALANGAQWLSVLVGKFAFSDNAEIART
jgi:hypothetical protein